MKVFSLALLGLLSSQAMAFYQVSQVDVARNAQDCSSSDSGINSIQHPPIMQCHTTTVVFGCNCPFCTLFQQVSAQ